MHKGTCFCLIPGSGQRGTRKGQRRIWSPVTGYSLGWATGGISIYTEQTFFPFSCVRGFAILNRKWEKPADRIGRKAAARCTLCAVVCLTNSHTASRASGSSTAQQLFSLLRSVCQQLCTPHRIKKDWVHQHRGALREALDNLRT